MQEKIPAELFGLVKTFEEAGFEIFLVGGCVRDLLVGRDVKDWDLTTNATPEQMQSLFPDSFYDNSFGTVGIPLEFASVGKKVVEVTTYRSESGYSDRRHPEQVVWGKTVEEDLSRRDFTINAMAMRIDVSIIDPFGGRKDLENKLVRAVGDANLRFKEDALRLMRAIRFATQLGFVIEEKTLQAVISDAPLLQAISKERVRDELLKILGSEFPYEGVMLLKNTALLPYILPELLEGIGVSQERPGRHHKTDVFTHNVLSLKYCPSVDPIVRLTALIHDIAKPRVAGTDEQGYVIFYNHEILGARMAKDITDRLKLSKRDRERMVILVRWHMFTVDEHTTDASIRRFIRRVGVENVKDMIDLRIADRLGSGTHTAESWRLKLFKKRLEEQLAPAPFSIKDLAIDGNDIMKELRMKPGPMVGQLLQTLFEEVDEDLSKNTKEFLIARLHEIVA